jgi:hypothetical protein
MTPGRRARALIALVVSIGVLSSLGAPSNAGAKGMPSDACPMGEVPLFAGGGTPLSTGVFFPGTAVYDDGYMGAPYVIPRGCNLRFINLDASVLTNAHQIMSVKRKRGRPLFWSERVAGPGQTVIRTAKLKPGTYPYYCVVHFGMLGLLEVAPD